MGACGRCAPGARRPAALLPPPRVRRGGRGDPSGATAAGPRGWRRRPAPRRLAPTPTVMPPRGAFGRPEHCWRAARWTRRSLARVLGELVAGSVWTAGDAYAAAEAILASNARRVYRFTPAQQ